MNKTKIILKAIERTTGQKCGEVKYSRTARDWKVIGVFLSDAPAILRELESHGIRRKQSSSGFYLERR